MYCCKMNHTVIYDVGHFWANHSFKQGSHVHKPPHQQHILKIFANSFGRLVKKSLALHTKENGYMCDGCSSPCVG